jgi:hypothetical protein
MSKPKSQESFFTVKAKCCGVIQPSMYDNASLITTGQNPFREALFSIGGRKEFAVDITEIPFPFHVGEELEIRFTKLPPRPYAPPPQRQRMEQ